MGLKLRRTGDWPDHIKNACPLDKRTIRADRWCSGYNMALRGLALPRSSDPDQVDGYRAAKPV